MIGAIVAVLMAAWPGAPCVDAAAVVTGQTVDCDGVLVAPDQARRLVECAAVDLPACAATRRDEAAAAAAKLATAEAIAEAYRDRAAAAEDALDRLASAATVATRPWHEHPAFVAAATLGAVAIVVAAVLGGVEMASPGALRRR